MASTSLPADEIYTPTPAPAVQAFDPRLPPQGFWGNVTDKWFLNESIQGARFLFENALPAEPGFDALTPENLKGMEEWAPWLAEARSPDHLATMKGRIIESEGRRDRLARDGGILSAIVGTLGAPENLAMLFIPGLGAPSLLGGGLRAAARSAGAFGAMAAGTAGVGLSVDPTYDKSEILTNVLTATVLGGVIGGTLGSRGARTANAFADAFVAEQRLADAVFAPDGPLATAERTGGRYAVRPTTPELQTGYKGMFGLENVISAPGLVDGKVTNPLFNAVAGLVQSNVQALQDLGLRIGGDFGLILRANAVEPTRASVKLRAGQWESAAADTDQGIFRHWQRYLGRESPVAVAGMDITGTLERGKDLLAKVVGGRRDGKLTFGEFREAVLDARRNGGKADLDRLRDTSEAGIHAVEAAQRETLAPFFEKMLKESTAINFLKTKEGTARRYAWLQEEWRKTVALEADPGLPATARDLIRRKKEAINEELKHLEQAGVRPPAPSEVTLRPTPPETTLGPETAPPFANDPGVAPTSPEAGVPQPSGASTTAVEGAPVKTFVTGDWKFDPPANDPGITIDPWEGRDLTPTVVSPAATRTGSPTGATPALTAHDYLSELMHVHSKFHALSFHESQALLDDLVDAVHQGATLPEVETLLTDAGVKANLKLAQKVVDAVQDPTVVPELQQLFQGGSHVPTPAVAPAAAGGDAAQLAKGVNEQIDKSSQAGNFAFADDVYEALKAATPQSLGGVLDYHDVLDAVFHKYGIQDGALADELAKLGDTYHYGFAPPPTSSPLPQPGGGLERLTLPHYETGRPVVADMFHGTHKTFEEFSNDFQGTGAGGGDTDGVIYFARNPDTTRTYSGTTGGTWKPDHATMVEGVLNADPHAVADAVDHGLKLDPHSTFWTNATHELTDLTHLLDRYRAGTLDKADAIVALEDFGNKAWAEQGGHGLMEALGLVKPNAPQTVMARVRLENPLVEDVIGQGWDGTRNRTLIQKAKAEGHDGVILLNTRDGGPTDVIYIVLAGGDNIRWRFDPADFAKRETIREGLAGLHGELHMPAPANDPLPPPPPPPAPPHVPGDTTPVRMRAENDNVAPTHTYDPFYAPRLWNKEKVEATRAELHTVIRENWEGPDPVPDAKGIEAMIDGLQAEEGHSFGGERAGAFFRHGRVIQVPDKVLRPWLENDPSVLVRVYGSRFGAGVEMQRAFGQRSGQLSLYDALIQAAREGKSAGELRAYEQMAEYLRASVLGDLHLGLPTTATAVMVDTAKNYTAMTVMNGTWLQQILETVRIPMAHGFGRTFGFLYDGMLGNMEAYRKLTTEMRSVVADLWDVSRGMAAQRWTEMGGPHANGTPMANAINRYTQPFNEFARGPYWLLNGMAQITDMQKSFTAAMAAHLLIDDMQTLVAGTARKKLVQNLNAVGIGIEEARLILSMPIERLGKVNIPAMSTWGESPAASEARALFGAAIQGDIGRVITTPSAATRSPMSQGFFHMSDDARRHFALVTLPFQFMSWGMAALSKVTGSALQGRDANAMVGIAALLGAGYLANWLRSTDHAWERQPSEERWLRAVENSGVGGILTTIPGMIERATYGKVGPRSAMGLPPRSGSEYTDFDALSVPFGAVGSKATDLWRVFMDPTLPEAERRGKAHRLIPLSELPYTKDLFRAAETYALSP